MRDRSSQINGSNRQTDPGRESGRIPTIAQYDCIMRQAGRIMDAPFQRDFLRNADGYQWATEPLQEYLTQNQAICATMYAVDAERTRS